MVQINILGKITKFITIFITRIEYTKKNLKTFFQYFV